MFPQSELAESRKKLDQTQAQLSTKSKLEDELKAKDNQIKSLTQNILQLEVKDLIIFYINKNEMLNVKDNQSNDCKLSCSFLFEIL